MKHNIMVMALGTLIVLQAPEATIIKVYDLKGNRDYDAMAQVAETLKTQVSKTGEPEKAFEGEMQGFGYRIVPGTRVTPDLSLVPGSSSYFWSSMHYEYTPEFSFKGGTAVFRSATTRAKLSKPPAETPPVSYTTSFNAVSGPDGSLTLRYSLAQPARVTMSVTSLDGKTVGRWLWHEGSAGHHVRSVNAGLARGAYFIHWSGDGVKRTQRIIQKGAH